LTSALILAAVVWSASVCAQNTPEPTVRLKGELLRVLGSARKLPQVETAAAQPITLTIMMNWSDPAGFDSYLRSFEDRASPLYRRRLAPEEARSRFGPTQAAYDEVTAYLRQNGFTPVGSSSNRLTLTVRGTRAQAERAFNVSINDYQLGARHFYANDADPAVPQSLAPMIRSISGLSNLAKPRPLAAPNPVSPLSFTTAYNGVLTAAGGYNTGGGLPPGVNGAGQKIALVEFDNFQDYELTASLVASRLPASLSNQVSRATVNGGALVSDLSGTQEVLLDLVVALGVAPGANVIVVSATSDTSVIDAVNAAGDQVRGTPGLESGVISDSWGGCEAEMSDSDLDSMEGLLQAFRIYGVSFFIGAGDTATTCVD
jgi:kumamolisin